MRETDSYTIDVDKDYQLINAIQKHIASMKQDEIVIQVITSPCFTQALVVFQSTT